MGKWRFRSSWRRKSLEVAISFVDNGKTSFLREEKQRSTSEKRDSFGNFLNHLLILPKVDCLDG